MKTFFITFLIFFLILTTAIFALLYYDEVEANKFLKDRIDQKTAECGIRIEEPMAIILNKHLDK